MSADTAEDLKPVRAIETPTSLTYTYSPGRAATRFLRAIEQKKLMGQRCPSCSKVYIPPRGACARCGVPTEEQVLLADKGTIVSFCIVRVPSENIHLELPYVAASILLDGADIPFQALVAEVKPETVRMGTRVQAVWVDDAELKPSFTNIKWFRPNGEPDVPFERFKEHL